MFTQRPVFHAILTAVMVMMILGSCTVVKNYPRDVPFVFANKINVQGVPSKDEKKRLQTELDGYWDDSIKVKSITQLGVRTVIRNPPVYDSAGVVRSIAFMNSYLNSQGYYNALFAEVPVEPDTVRDQIRKTVLMNITLGRNLRIDSFAFDTLMKPELRKLAMENSSQSLLGSNKPFSKQLVASELDRLVALFRKNGYFHFTRENLYAEIDTTDVTLLQLTLDPFEQARIIAEANQRRRLDPTVDVVIKQKNTADSNSFTKFYIGNIHYYPETGANELADSVISKPYSIVFNRREITSHQNEGYSHMKPLREHTYLRRGVVYNEEKFYKTVNSLNQLGAWSQVDVRSTPHVDSVTVRENETATAATYFDTVPLLDFHFLLTPAKKYSFGSDFEVSRNSGTISTGNLLGIGNNTTIRNRNVWKESIQSSTALRTGVEVSFSDTIPLQTLQASLSHTFSIPQFITPIRLNRLKRLDDYKTLVSFSAGYTERRNFYRLRTLVASWGYEWKRKTNLWSYRLLNVELYTLDTLRLLTKAFVDNPFLRTAFNTGYVVSQNLTYNKIFPGSANPDVTNYIRLFGEEAGGIAGALLGLNKVYRYLKAEGEFRQLRPFRKTAFAYRVFGGIGYNYSNDPVLGQSLPFFKQFVAGGPNSMRAWQVRQLGLGSSLISDTSTSFRDRFGDIQLETNLEYRFPITVIGGVKVNSALFADIGNIWNLKNSVSNPESKLTFNRFLKDLAIGVGTGVRLDFNYFLIRVDLGFKLKDPARRENNGWLNLADFTWRNRELENPNPAIPSARRNNYAIQLGIGLPF